MEPRRLPFFPVNHIHGHLAAAWLADPAAPFPMVTLVASGGHTALIRVDDRSELPACWGRPWTTLPARRSTRGPDSGPGIPRGEGIGRAGGKGRPRGLLFPHRPEDGRRGPDFSFSGVKTALYYLLRGMTRRQSGRREPPTSLPHTARRSWPRLVEQDGACRRARRRCARRRSRGGGGELLAAQATGRARAQAGGTARGRAPLRLLHRQCRHDRRSGAWPARASTTRTISRSTRRRLCLSGRLAASVGLPCAGARRLRPKPRHNLGLGLTNPESGHNIADGWHSAVESANCAKTVVTCLSEARVTNDDRNDR